MEMVMPEKKKATKPAAKKAKATKAAKKSPARVAWERRSFLYAKQLAGEAMTGEETTEARMICRQRGDLVPGPEPAE